MSGRDVGGTWQWDYNSPLWQRLNALPDLSGERRRRALNAASRREGWLANPNADGYGRQNAWPFNRNYAVSNSSYRYGIERALENPLYASNWKFAAGKLLCEVYELVALQNYAYMEMLLEELEDFAERGEI